MKWQCRCCLLLLPPTSHSLSSGQGAHPSSGTFGPQLQTKNNPQPTHPHCLRFPGKAVKRKRTLAKPFSPLWTTSGTQVLAPAQHQQHLFIFPDTVRQNYQRWRVGPRNPPHTAHPKGSNPTTPHPAISASSKPAYNTSTSFKTPSFNSRASSVSIGFMSKRNQTVNWLIGCDETPILFDNIWPRRINTLRGNVQDPSSVRGTPSCGGTLSSHDFTLFS